MSTRRFAGKAVDQVTCDQAVSTDSGISSPDVVMTTASVICAFGMMPLNLFIYSRSWTDEDSVIPYTQIVITLLSILVPVIFGMIIRYKLKKLAPYIVKLGSVLGILGISVGVILNGFINPRIFTSGWKVWFASIMLPYFGFTFGYVLARILKQSHTKCRTIAFETGSQNVALSLTLISFSDSPQFGDLMIFPSLFGIFIFVDAVIVVLLYRIVTHFKTEPSFTKITVEHHENDRSLEGKELETVDN
ncbi:ileal sodium/bile acid cotransporter-like [Amphiura filiformis]|uniref:ileal sodium/bile acid cotransporter-like n=1 Tax=Amphiura filiformis TaxID=82378 RepID=UPI003B2197E7